MANSTNVFRRRFLQTLSVAGFGAVAGIATARSAAGEALKSRQPTYERLLIPDDWYIVGYKTCYHRRAIDPKHLVDLLTVVGRNGGCSVDYVRRQIIAMSATVAEVNEGIAYLNRGIRDG